MKLQPLPSFVEPVAPEWSLDSMVGQSRAMAELIGQIRVAARFDALPVLLTGETGSGKSHIASVLHRNSSRAGRPFVEVNCAAIPRDLWEAEFFGCTRNAYTHAAERAGRFAAAAGGTLFLDEIGEIPVEHQAKLLRVLDHGQFERLGEDRTRRADVRLIAATNRDLNAAVREGSFRADLLFCIDRYRIAVPRLEDRREDIPQLCAALLERECRALGLPQARLAPSALRALEQRAWPGNIRELQSVLARALITAAMRGQCELGVEHFAFGVMAPSHAPSRPPEPAAAAASRPLALAEAIEQFKRDFIEEALRLEHGNMSRASRRLSVARSHLYTLVEQFALRS